MGSEHPSRIDQVRDGFLDQGLPEELVNELLAAFVEAKQRYYRRDHRPNAIEGGRFAEAAFRILQYATSGTYTPRKKSLKRVDQLLTELENSTGHEAVRLHIPRTLRLIYDVRSKRSAAHLADDIDPNYQDSTLVVANMSWVLAELVRLYHNVTPDEATQIITDLVTREVPVVQMFDGVPRILRDMAAGDVCLVLLYTATERGLEIKQLQSWVPKRMRPNLRRTLGRLDDKHLVHIQDGIVYITERGEQEVEGRGLAEPASN